MSRVVSLLKRDGSKELKLAYEPAEFPFWELTTGELVGGRNKKKFDYLMNIATYDIETTTISEVEHPYGFMYFWGMCVDNILVYGRTWMEWIDFMLKLVEVLGVSATKRLVIPVHNLSFEMQFCKEFCNEYFGGVEVFATDRRKPIKFTCGNGLEFRCTYRLSNMTLDKAVKFEKGVQHIKRAGDLDYKKIRTPLTHLNNTEFSYAMSDVQSLYEYYVHVLQNNGDNLRSLPCTSTGFVRRSVRNATKEDPNYRKYFWKNKLTESVYILLKEAGRGGDTHAHRIFSGRLLEDCVSSYDKKSSYPWQMCSQNFPCTKLMPYGRIDNVSEFNALVSDYACLFRVAFVNLEVKNDISRTYIPASKIRNSVGHFTYDNGRVLSTVSEGQTGYFEMTITDIDYKIIRENYKWDNMIVWDFHFAKYALLPECIRKTVFEWFIRKCELEWLEEQEPSEDNTYRKGKFKNQLNGIFGLAFTDPVRDLFELNDDMEWLPAIPANIAEALEQYNTSWNSFMVYAVGVWVTAWGRKELDDLLKATSTEGNFVVYWDTDSSKCIIENEEPIKRLNDKLRTKAENMGLVVDCHGEKKYLGLCENETPDGPYKQFKTLGAKKYAYLDKKGLHVTISGVGKKTAPKELKQVDNLKNGFIFSGDAGGKELYYNDEPIHTIEVNGCEILTASNVALVDSTYTVGITTDYGQLIALYDDIDYGRLEELMDGNERQ